MKFARIAVIMLVFTGMATFNPADAQFKRLRNKAKDKVEQKAKEKQREKERKLEAKVDKKLDDAIEGAEDSAGSIFERKAEEIMANAMGDIEEPFDLGPNESGNADASYVYYRSVSKMQMAGMDAMPPLFERLLSVNEVHYIHSGSHRTDSQGNSTILDASGKRMINVQHADETYAIRTFEEIADMISDLSDQNVSVETGEPDMSRMDDLKVSVQETGDRETINNVLSDRRIMIIEGVYESESGSDTQEGKFFFVTDAWISTAIAGYKTINDTNMEIASSMGSAFGNSGNPFEGILAMMNNQQASGAMAEALAELKKMGGGLPVRSDSYMVQAPKDATLDLDKVLSGELGAMNQGQAITSQQTVFAIRTNIGDLTTNKFDIGLLGEPSGYSEIEYANPWAIEE